MISKEIPPQPGINGHNEASRASEVLEPVRREAEIENVLVGYQGAGPGRWLDPEINGFQIGHAYEPEFDLHSTAAHEHHAGVVAEICEDVARKKGWSHVDLLVTASITTREEIVPLINQRLDDRGITVTGNLFYSYACLGGMAGVIDVLMDPKNKGKKVIVEAHDFLSGNAVRPGDTKVSDMFGNGIGYMAFIAGEDIECLWAHIVSTYNDSGDILVPVGNPLPPESQRIEPPSYYETYRVANTGNKKQPYRLLPDTSHFAWTETGRYQDFLESDSGYTELNDGKGMLENFSHFGSLFISSDLEIYRQMLQPKYGELGRPWMHQPSLPVAEGLERWTRQNTLSAFGIPESFVRKLNKLEDEERIKILTAMHLPDLPWQWMMRESLVNNVSGPMSFAQLTEMALKGLVDTEKVIPAHSFAIGMMFANAFFRFKKKDHAQAS